VKKFTRKIGCTQIWQNFSYYVKFLVLLHSLSYTLSHYTYLQFSKNKFLTSLKIDRFSRFSDCHIYHSICHQVIVEYLIVSLLQSFDTLLNDTSGLRKKICVLPKKPASLNFFYWTFKNISAVFSTFSKFY